MVNIQLKAGGNPGVWIAGTDVILYGKIEEYFDWKNFKNDALCITVKSNWEEAKLLGYVQYNTQDSLVTGIIHGKQDRTDYPDYVDAIGDIVYLKTEVVETLLKLVSKAPLDRATYLGILF